MRQIQPPAPTNRADHGPEPRHDRPGRAANERARNCAVLIGPSFGPLPQANWFCFVAHVASSLKGTPPKIKMTSTRRAQADIASRPRNRANAAVLARATGGRAEGLRCGKSQYREPAARASKTRRLVRTPMFSQV